MRAVHALALTCAILPCAGVRAQSSPVPGSPSLPLSPAALANGVANRITYQYGTEFVTIGAPGNAPYSAPNPGDDIHGRGGVNYEYRIGRYEVTTTQWVGFMNAAFDRPGGERIAHLIPPDFASWGGIEVAPNNPGGRRFAVRPGQDMHPVGDISWRMAAIYTNWLHNDQSAATASFMNGAYDVTTFGFQTGTSIFTDQIAHNPGARFWIPTWDESLKAAHFDPNKSGQGQAGYWEYNISQGTAPAYGPPGQHVTVLPANPGPDPNGPVAQANSGWSDQFPGFGSLSVPLGAYANVAQSSWGLLDSAGGTREWTEEVRYFFGVPFARLTDGSAWLDSAGTARATDWIGAFGSELPHVATFDFGFRVAAAIPSPGCTSLAILVGSALILRRRERGTTALMSLS